MQNRNVARFERGGDLVQPPVGAAKNGLIAQADALAFELADCRGNALLFIVIAFRNGAGQEQPDRRRGRP